jgi:transposase
VSKAFVQRLLKPQKIKGHLQPGKQGGTIPSELDGYLAQLAPMVDTYPDATRSEYCEYWGETHDQWVSTSTICRALHAIATEPKKTTIRSRQCATLRVQKLRIEYGKQVLNIDPENLVFLDEMGVLLGLTLSHARSFHGTRVYDLKPFYRGACAHGYRSN